MDSTCFISLNLNFNDDFLGTKQNIVQLTLTVCKFVIIWVSYPGEREYILTSNHICGTLKKKLKGTVQKNLY